MSDHFDRAMSYLEGRTDFESKDPSHSPRPSLEPIKRVAEAMADPQRTQPVIHVTGTNGKGSTSAVITELLLAHDLSVGTYTSPDLGRVNERIARNSQPIGDEELCGVLESIAELESLTEQALTRFEVLTLAAFRWFAESAVDVAVVEVGMGGRWDATNIADAEVAVLTNVSNDHLDVLGPTITDVAMEKVGIVKPGAAFVFGQKVTEDAETEALAHIVERAAHDRGASSIWRAGREFSCRKNELAVGGRLIDLITPDASYQEVLLPLHGAHQGDNAALGLAAVEAFFSRALDDGLVRSALSNLSIPGRFEVIGRQPLVVLDGAHNPAGAATARSTLGDFNVEGFVLVVGMTRGREAASMFEALQATQARAVVVCEPDTPRAVSSEELAQAAREMGMQVIVVPRVKDAIDRAISLVGPGEAVLVTGSLYVVSEARGNNSPSR